MSNSCGVCQKSANQTCSGCNQIYYCSKEHQKNDWKSHKLNCRCYKITKNEKLGRFLIATRTINPGEIILKAKPLVLAPKTVSSPMCLACHQMLDLANNRFNCPECQWPLCGPQCLKTSQHETECAIYAKSKFRPTIHNDKSKQSIYASVAIVRALALREEILPNFQSHLDRHASTKMYQILKASLVPFILHILALETDESEILSICSIFDTNSFDIRLNNVNIRGLYPTASLVSHDCCPNTKHTFDNTFALTLYATRTINKGDMITATYSQTLWSSLERQEHLRMAKLFDCECARCLDPTEYGTFLGSFLCQICGSGFLTSCNTLNRTSDWKCQKCGVFVPVSKIIMMNNDFKKKIRDMVKDPEHLERFLSLYSNVLHDNHGFVLEVKYALNQLYALSMDRLERKLELCQQLLKVADILEPDYSRFRGLLLYDILEISCLEQKITNVNNFKILHDFDLVKNILKTEPDFEIKLLKMEMEINEIKNKVSG